MTTASKRGGVVKWESSQGTVTGKVEKKRTTPTDIAGHHVAASKDNPESRVRSAKTGAVAAHGPGTLKQRRA
jgi:Hypervirulence associated proteins TUDOR domain